MRAAAQTFSITSKLGPESVGVRSVPVMAVYSPLDTTVTLLEDAGRHVCIISSHLKVEEYRFSNLLRKQVAEVLDTDVSNVFCFSSHNHCTPSMTVDRSPFGTDDRNNFAPWDSLTWEGRLVIEQACDVAKQLLSRLRDARVMYGLGHEGRISYNRKGHRADGSTYLMREEDRLKQGADFNGDIDTDAGVLAFVDSDDKPISFLVGFTAHPVTAYHPESLVTWGEYCQFASHELGAAFGDVPVGFLQGCAGDINAKGLMSHKPADENVEDSKRYGKYLGETYISAAGNLTPSTRSGAAVAWRTIHLPFTDLPDKAQLDEQIADMEDFIARCGRDDPDTQRCQGLNFPSNMSPKYRAVLVDPLYKWARWARSLHDGPADQIPRGRNLRVGAIRLGDVGIVGMPCEPFLEIGRRIRNQSPYPLTFAGGYMNDNGIAYVPDSGNNGDAEYMSAFYRYTTTMLPYAQPAGDYLADQCADLLASINS